MQDKETKIDELRNLLKTFRDERDWGQFHDPKNLAEAILIEAGELLELFLWKDKREIAEKIKVDEKFKREIEKEFSDIVIFCINFANAVDIDLSKSVKEKIEENRKKYPIDKTKGVAIKYNKL